MPDVKIFGRVRQLAQGFDQASVGDDEQIALTEQLEQLVAIGTSAYGEIVKIGRAFRVNTTTAIAAVTAIPTTACLLALFNNEDDNGRSYIIDRVWALQAAAATQADAQSLICLLGSTREAAPTDAALKVVSLNGTGHKDSKARTILNATALPATTGIAGDWFPPTQLTNAQAGAFGGCSITANIDGRIIVPPGRYFAMHVLSGHVTNTFQGGIEWHERQIRLG